MRCVALIAGLGALALAWGAPAWTLAFPFADHMARHMALVAVAAPLIALAAARSFTPVIPPLVAAAVELGVVWGWHLPAAHEAAQTSSVWYVAEQASFLGAGLAIWFSALHPLRPLAGAGAMLLTSMHMTLLGALLILSRAALYPAAICGGAADQQIGGMIMLSIGAPVYLAAGLLLTRRAMSADTAVAE